MIPFFVFRESVKRAWVMELAANRGVHRYDFRRTARATFLSGGCTRRFVVHFVTS